MDFETRILRLMPQLLLGGGVPLAVAALVFSEPLVDILALATALAYWMCLLALGLVCFIVSVLKGPRRSADPYWLPEDS